MNIYFVQKMYLKISVLFFFVKFPHLYLALFIFQLMRHYIKFKKSKIIESKWIYLSLELDHH